MATGHQLSVITNLCVKPPSFISSAKRNNENNLVDDTYFSDSENVDPINEPIGFKTSFNDAHSGNVDNLEGLSDTEFYKKLIELRKEHKKTLEICERLYNDKLGSLSTPSPKSNIFPDYVLPDSEEFATASDSHSKETSGFGLQNLAFSADRIRDMSITGKPPSGKSFKRSVSPLTFPGEQNSLYNDETSVGEFWHHDSLISSHSDVESREISRRSMSNIHNDTRASAMSKIEDMFVDFTVDEYAPRTRQRSNSTSALATSKKEVKEWQHKVTIPQPFSMTLREETKPKKKNALIAELEKQREEKIKREEAECQKSFKARPVPANVYLPLFEEIMEKKEARRREIKQNRTEILQTMQKPFKFCLRDDKMKARQSCLESEFKPKTEFKASPYPAHIFDNHINDKILEEEEYRKIRVQMRSEELLRSASLPPNMEARGKEYIIGKSRQKARIEKMQNELSNDSFRPKISHDVPNFSEIHQKFLREVEGKRQPKEATFCKPFVLRTEERLQRQKSLNASTSTHDDRNEKEYRWPYANKNSQVLSKSLGSISSSFDATIPPKMTASIEIKAQAIQKKKQQEIQNRRLKEDEEKVRKLKEQQMRAIVAEKAAASDSASLTRKSADEKTQELRKQTVEQTRVYKKSLKDLSSKLADRPFLFEQVAQNNAKKRMEKKYKDTLTEYGLSEEYIHKMGASATSEMSIDELGRSGSVERLSSPSQNYVKHSNGYQSPLDERRSNDPMQTRDRIYSDDFETVSNSSRNQTRNRVESESSDVQDDVANRSDELEELE